MGRVAGAPVILAPSWLVAVVVLTVVLVPRMRSQPGLDGPAVWVAALAFVVLLFASVFLHELAHGLVARARGQQPQEFVLTLWSGHTAFGGAAPTPATNALVAIVGPMVNLALGAGFWFAMHGVADESLAQVLLASGAITNGFVGLFNLLPGLPFDGGRVLESAVWALAKHRHAGTVAAGWVGRVVAVGVAVWGVVALRPVDGSGSPFDMVWAFLIGAFLWAAASAEMRGSRARRKAEAVTFATVGRPAVAVGHGDSLAHASAVASAAGVQDVVVLSPDGRAAAYIDRAAAASVPAQAAGSTPVTAVSIPLPVGATVDGALVGSPFVAELARAMRLSPVVVVLVDGRVVGLVHAPDVVAAFRS